MNTLDASQNAPSCVYPSCGCIGYGYVPVQEMQEVYAKISLSTKGDKFKKYAKKAVAHTSCNSFITETYLLTIQTYFTIKSAKNNPFFGKNLQFLLAKYRII